jgi:hypothetical protein
MKQTAVEWLQFQIDNKDMGEIPMWIYDFCQQAKEIEKEQIFLALNQSAKEAYKAGQKTMECGCYEISDATTYEEWLYEKFKEQ